MMLAYNHYASNEAVRDLVSNFIFTDACDSLLAGFGYAVNGATISVAQPVA